MIAACLVMAAIIAWIVHLWLGEPASYYAFAADVVVGLGLLLWLKFGTAIEL